METAVDAEKLVRAIFSQTPEVVVTLGQRVANIDDRGRHWTPLHAAIETGSSAMVEAVLKLGANPNCAGGTGLPLSHAIDLEIDTATQDSLPSVPDMHIIEVLLRYGADPRVFDESGESPLGFAAARNHDRALRLFTATPDSPP